MAKPTEYRHDLVLFVALHVSKRAGIIKVLRNEGYQTEIVDDLKAAAERLAKNKPGVLVHDWGCIDPTQSIKFQRQLAKVTDYVGMCRIIYAESMSPQLLAQISDCGVRRVVAYSATLSHLATEIKMAHTLTRNLAGLQVLVQKFHTGGEYDQYEIDQAIVKAKASFPHDPVVAVEYGNLCARGGKLDQARVIAEGLIKDNPTNVRAMNLLGRTIMAQGKIDEAITVLKAADMLSPLDAERLLLLAEAFLKKGDSKGAAGAYGNALIADPTHKDAQRGLGMIKLREGDVNAAIELFRQSVSEDEAVSMFNNAAVIAIKAGNHAQGVELYNAALLAVRSNELKSVIHYNLALAYERDGKASECKEHLELAVQLNPKNEKARRKRGQCAMG